jgi:hypothetical protein
MFSTSLSSKGTAFFVWRTGCGALWGGLSEADAPLPFVAIEPGIRLVRAFIQLPPFVFTFIRFCTNHKKLISTKTAVRAFVVAN